jgi:hypothetical protein
MPDRGGADAIDGPSPARLYATLIGGVLVVAGIVGFFYSASFGSPGEVDDVFGVLSVNAWHNVFHVATGALGLLVAGYAARQYSLCLGVLYLALAGWGFVIGSGAQVVLGFIPVNTADDFLHLVLGLLGVAAAFATPTTSRAASSASRPGAASAT